MEDGFVPFDSKEFNFTSYLSNARERFTGRLWLYNELETNLMKQDTDRGVLVIARRREICTDCPTDLFSLI